MNNNIFFSIVSFVYILLLLVVFFYKKRFNSLENKLFTSLVITNFIGTIVEISIIFSGIIMDKIPIINIFVSKTYLVYLFVWIVLFTFYIFTITKSNLKFMIIKSKLKYIILFFAINIVIIYLLPLNYYFEPGKKIYSYTYGLGVNFIFLISAICILICIGCMICNFKNMKNRKYVPLFVFLSLGSLVMILQAIFPNLLLITSMETFVTFLMYFTIENPDLQMLREIHNAKEYNDNLNIEKSRFLFNMTKEVKVPLQNINRVSKDILMEDDIKIIKEDASKIKYSSNNLLELVNKVLDISDLEKRKISTRQSKYNIELLFKKIISQVKPKIEGKGIEFRIKYDKSIPTNIYGDNVRIKQVILAILNHCLETTKEGFIELDINSIIKHDNCRIVINIEDSSIGMSREQVEKLFEVNIEKDIEKIDDKDISIGLVKKILDLIGGTIIVNSEIGKGTKYTVVVDQQISDSKKNTIEQAVEKYEELYIKNKRILLVINNEDLNKKLTKLLNKYEVEVVRVTGGQACLEKIRKNELYDLIIMEDELEKLSSIDTLNKLKQIENFKIPVIILTRKIELNIKKEYSKIGFTDTYIIPVNKTSIDEIVHKYVLDNN